MAFDYRPALQKQLQAMRARMAEGMPRRGWKVGINVPEVQRRVGIQRSLFGWLDGDRVLSSGAAVEVPPGARLHVEPELCLRLATDVSSQMDVAEARACVDGVAAALEVVDYAKPAEDVEQLIEHSMYHHGCVVGSFWPAHDADALDIVDEIAFQVGETPSEPARGDLVPRDPGELLLRLVSLLEELGEQLRAGDLVLSGSFTMHALPIAPMEVAKADYGRFGQVQCRTVA